MKHYHFIGIGGISMSGIAMILKSRGYIVTGSDRSENEMVRALEKAGIPVAIGQKASNITSDIDTVVYTAAIHDDNEELIAARAVCPRVIERSVMLGELLNESRIPIAVAGTHGKTSTSSILACILMAAGKDPSFSIGGVLASTNTNYRVGKGDHMLIEACEYHDSFLDFHPVINIITNIEPEHLDYFKTFENELASFDKYVSTMRPGGVLITSPQLKEHFKTVTDHIFTVSVDGPSDIYAIDIVRHETGLGSSFHVVYQGQDLGQVDLYVPGRHLIYDCLCAIMAAIYDGIPFEAIQQGVAGYKATKKRFEYLGSWHGTAIVDDYAHHPSEIKATLKAAREIPMKDLWVAFQPHTYSRTINFFDDFVDALSMADHIVLADIYAAREVDTGVVSSKMLADALRERGKDAYYFPTFDEIKNFLEKNISPKDLLITMGAGTIVDVAHSMLSEK